MNSSSNHVANFDTNLCVEENLFTVEKVKGCGRGICETRHNKLHVKYSAPGVEASLTSRLISSHVPWFSSLQFSDYMI